MSYAVEWGKERTIQLIHLIRKKECIWNPNYPDNTALRKSKAWDDIVSELKSIDPDITLFDVKDRYGNFRNQYIRIVRNYELTGETPKSYLYNLLNFIPIPPRCKTPFKWSNKQTSKIIALLKPHECLWLKQDKNYRNMEEKDEALSDIHQEMKKYIPELTLAHVIKKIRVLKYSFNCYERRKGKTKFRQKVPWWYTKLSFMKRNSLEKNDQFIQDEKNFAENKTEHFEITAAKEDNEESSDTEMDNDGASTEPSNDIIKYKWPKQALLKLLNLMERHECLWLKSHPYYNKGEIRDQITRKIFQRLKNNYPNLTLYLLQRKITHMKYSFYSYNSKEEMKLESGKTPPWWYTKMEFMKKNLTIDNWNGAIFDFNEVLINEADNDIKKEETDATNEECEVDNFSEIKIEPVSLVFDYNLKKNTCRFCLKNNGEINLNDTLGVNTCETFIECAERYFKLNHDENMPKKLCANCANQVIATYELGEKIFKSNEQLKHILSSQKDFGNASTRMEDLNETTGDISTEEDGEQNMLIHVEQDEENMLTSVEQEEHNIEPGDELEAQNIQVSDVQNEQMMLTSDEETFNESENENLISIETVNIDRLSVQNSFDNDPYHEVEPLMDIDAGSDIKNESESEEQTDAKKCSDKTETATDIDGNEKEVDSDTSVVPNKKIRYKGPRLLCHICSETFKTPASLQSHLERHNENRERKYKCEICGLKSFTLTGHNEHKKIHDPNRTKFQCEFCEKSYYKVGSLNVHRKLHTGNLIQCSLCPKTFNTRAAYKHHMNVHTGNKTLECEYCGEKFFRNSALSTHKQEHYNLKWKCPKCPKEFSKRQSLRCHLFTHSGYPYQCDICGISKRSKYDCQSHIKQAHKIDDQEEAMTHIKFVNVKRPKTVSYKDLIAPEEIAAIPKKAIL